MWFNKGFIRYYDESKKWNHGQYCYDIQQKTIVEFHDRTNQWFDADNDFVFWSKTDSLTNETTLEKTPHGDTTITELAKGKIWAEKMLGEHIYYRDEDDKLLRISKHNGLIETVLSSQAGFISDNGYVVWDDIVYMTDCYPQGILSGLQINYHQKGFVTFDKRGIFDDDDMNYWLWTDKQAL